MKNIYLFYQFCRTYYPYNMAKYKTLKALSTGGYREKGSRFIAYAFPCESEEHAKKEIEKIAKEHHKARHVCYAYSIGAKNPLTKYSDAHEPANTAGLPILNQIRKYKLNNAIIIVVRYFGGVLLGKGGLARAYGSAAENAILQGNIIEKEETSLMKIKCDYTDFPLVMDALKRFNIKNIKQDFQNVCQVIFEYNLDDEIKIRSALVDFGNLKFI